MHAGAPVLEARGARGTWFVAAGLAGVTGHLGRMATLAEARDLAGRGHELACHTFSHGDCARQDRRTFAADLDRNAESLRGLGCGARTFAYPYGEVSFGAKRELGGRFALARTVRAGLVRRGSDLMQAPGVGLQGRAGEAQALRWLARAAAGRAWVILFTHDVQAQPTEWGCTPEALARTADAALAAGLEIVPVSEGARRMGALA